MVASARTLPYWRPSADQRHLDFQNYEHDIAQLARRVLVFKDGRIRKDEPSRNPPRAAEVLMTLPTLED